MMAKDFIWHFFMAERACTLYVIQHLTMATNFIKQEGKKVLEFDSNTGFFVFVYKSNTFLTDDNPDGPEGLEIILV